jgi:spore germination protein YaaH
VKSILFVIFSFYLTASTAQSLFKSIMQEESEFYRSFRFVSDTQFDSLNNAGNTGTASEKLNTCTLSKRVFGWHPYWGGTSYTSYQWNLLSDLCYFDYTVSNSTGNNTNASFAWNTASVVTVAKNNGTKIHICATMFSGHSTFWASSSAQTTFINNIISLLNTRGGNGVNIDFEGMGASDKIPFTNFIANLNSALNAANPSYELSVCLYAVEWSSVFDIPALNSQVDFYTIMGYDYYYGGSSTAGPTSPLYNFQTSYNYTLSKSITYYIKQGAPVSKLLMGLPYYGREWQTTSNSVPSATSGTFNASRTLSYVNNNPATYSITNKFWEGTCFSPYYTYQSSGNWRQCWIDDAYSLGRKYDMVLQRGLGGIAIWALGYDNGMNSYWNLLQNKFSDCAPIICSDSLYDMGGPARNYYDNENYSFSISAPTGSLVQLQFKSFGTEANYDSLWLYNGFSTNAPLIGAYTGTNSPGIVVSSGQNVTLRFKSDGATNSFGFKIIKNCIQQITTEIAVQDIRKDLMLYPNPSTGKFYFESEKSFSVLVYDITGKIVFEDLNAVKEIDLVPQKVSPGIYFLDLQSDGKVYRTKIIIID